MYIPMTTTCTYNKTTRISWSSVVLTVYERRHAAREEIKGYYKKLHNGSGRHEAEMLWRDSEDMQKMPPLLKVE